MVIELYSLATPNGQKIGIALEEMGIEYNAHRIDITKGEQFKEDFLKIAPNNKIPAIVDTDNNLSLFESGAILQYLADKSGKFIPARGTNDYYTCLQWLTWQVAGLGPMTGQIGYFYKYCPEVIPLGRERYLKETQRLWRVLEKQLEGKQYVIGDEYTIADMAIFPWLRVFHYYGQEVIDSFPLDSYPNIKKYIERIEARPAVQKGLKVTPMNP